MTNNFKFKILNLKNNLRGKLEQVDWDGVKTEGEMRISRLTIGLKKGFDIVINRKWDKNDIKRYIKNLKKISNNIALLLIPKEGNLNWKRVFKISLKNLIFSKSKVGVTIGGVGVGIGAIVLLVSFGYGLQEVVTTRIIWPEALRIAEVSSENTSVKINRNLIEKIEGVSGVEMVAPSVRLAGQVYFNGSKIDAVVVGAGNNYLNLSDFKLLKGQKFSEGADLVYFGGEDISKILDEEKGVVAGVSTEELKIKEGDLAEKKDIWFRIRDGMYAVTYQKPRETALVAGFVQGSILKSHKGSVVWGGVYDDVTGLGRVKNDKENLMGKWIEAELPLWELIEGVYKPVTEEGGSQKSERVFLSMKDVIVLSEIEKRIEVMLENEGMILGETDNGDDSTQVSEIDTTVRVGTEAAVLVNELSKSVDTQEESESETKLTVWEDSQKEIIISQALVRAWNKSEEELMNENIELQYIITSTILPKLNGKVLSDKVSYRIVGIVADSIRPIVFVPLGDVESMGVNNYSNLKVLAINEQSLPEVRSLIQTMGLVTKSVADTLSQIARLFTIVRFLLGSFGAIALVVALFGMFNTLTVSLLERTREIGVMKSLGTTNVDVTRIFLVEAVFISASGGVLGVLIGRILGMVVDYLFFKSVERMGASLFMLPIWFDLFIFLIAIMVGLVTGWYPSKRASKISALNALRYE